MGVQIMDQTETSQTRMILSSPALASKRRRPVSKFALGPGFAGASQQRAFTECECPLLGYFSRSITFNNAPVFLSQILTVLSILPLANQPSSDPANA